MTGIDPEIVERATLAYINASRDAHGLSPLDRLPWTDNCDSVYGYTRAALEAVAPLVAAKAVEDTRKAIRSLADEWEQRADFNAGQGGEFWRGMVVKGRECASEVRDTVARTVRWERES